MQNKNRGFASLIETDSIVEQRLRNVGGVSVK